MIPITVPDMYFAINFVVHPLVYYNCFDITHRHFLRTLDIELSFVIQPSSAEADVEALKNQMSGLKSAMDKVRRKFYFCFVINLIFAAVNESFISFFLLPVDLRCTE